MFELGLFGDIARGLGAHEQASECEDLHFVLLNIYKIGLVNALLRANLANKKQI